jgi:dipeptidyl aminopeptidase/acylaminoacyl peptidase
VLVYDKRGSGQSSGNWIESPFSTLKDDVLSIIELVKEDSSIGKIGLWGGSEGSCIALWAAAESDLVSFIIAQSFTATSFADQNRYQTRLSTQSIVNNNKELIKARMKVQELVYNYARTGKGYDKYVESVNALRRNPWFTQILGEAMRRDDKWWSWYKTKMDIKPIAFLKKVNAPVLFIWGELDKLVPVEQSYRLVIAQAKGKEIKTIIFKGANHSLYNNTAEPVHLKVMQDWLIRIRDSLIATNT